MIHLNLTFPTPQHLTAFLNDPLNYTEGSAAPTLAISGELRPGIFVPVAVAANATIDTFKPMTATELANVAMAQVGATAAKRGPGRPKKSVAVADAQPAVASNTGSPSTGSQAVLLPVGDGAGTTAAGPEANSALSPAVVESVTAPTLDDVRAALGDFNLKTDMETARDLLKKFGATRVSELKPEVYASFIAACAQPVVA